MTYPDLRRRVPQIRRNLATLYRRATDAERSEGRDWYPKARAIVRDWATTYGYHDATVACVIATISPQLDWPRNLTIADDILAGRLPSINSAILSNLTKARRMLQDGAVETASYMPYGPKVFSFAANLAGNDFAVTLDGHAIQAALNTPDMPSKGLRHKHYMLIAEQYRHVARRYQLQPCELQAIIWGVWKRLYPSTLKRELQRRKWFANVWTENGNIVKVK